MVRATVSQRTRVGSHCTSKNIQHRSKKSQTGQCPGKMPGRLLAAHTLLKQIQTPRYIVQNSMNLKQYRHRPSHDSSQCFNLFPASDEKIRKTYRLKKRVFGKKSTGKQCTIHSNNFIPFKMFHFKSHPY